MKKILILNTTVQKGGAARVAYDIYKNLNSSFDIWFAYGRGKKEKDKKLFYFGNKLESALHLLLVRMLGIEGLGSYFSTQKLIRFIKKEKFDLINIHNLHGYYLNFSDLLLFLEKEQIPICYSLHDEWPITWLPAHSMECIHCKTGTSDCSNTYQYPKSYCSLFVKHSLNKKHIAFSDQLNMTIICPSVWLKTNVKKSFLNKFEIKLIRNGVDTNIFVPREDKTFLRKKYNLPLEKKIVLFSASNLKDKSKGVHHILKSAELLTPKEYLFIGIGAGTIPETENVKFLKYIYEKKMLSEIYALSDLFCFASNAETFLLSAAEALSCGVPVVGFDIPVVRELVTEDVGVLTKKDSFALADTIDKIFIDEKALSSMRIEARKLIENEYSQKRFYTEYKDIYERK